MKEIFQSIGSLLVLAILVAALSFGIFKHDDLKGSLASAYSAIKTQIMGNEVIPAPVEAKEEVVVIPAVAQLPKQAPVSSTKYRIDADYNVVPVDPKGNKNVVLLTIDDGPKAPKTLDPILKAMDEADVHAIFFTLGYLIKSKPEYLKKISDAGHTIGNHTWDHQNLKNLSNDKAKREIDDTSDIIEKTTGTPPLFFRPPFGSSSEYAKTHVMEEKMVFMNWSEGGEDWITKYQTKDALIKHVVEGLHPGANILLHELAWTAAAMPDIIAKIKEKGYTIIDPKDIETVK